MHFTLSRSSFGAALTRHETLETSRNDGILFVTVNRPDSRNALDADVQRDLLDLLGSAGDDDQVHGVIFSGTGSVFVSGADIASVRDRDLHAGLKGQLQRLLGQLQSFEKPTITAINGHALGGGLEFALATDIRLAVSTAKLGLPEVGLGIIPGAGGTQRLARHVGLGRAVEMILTGRLLTADEAQAFGVIAEVTSSEDLIPRATSVMQSILAKAPLAVRLAKMVTRTALDVDENTGLTIERLAQALLYTTEDKREGTTAFLERRRPQFTGE